MEVRTDSCDCESTDRPIMSDGSNNHLPSKRSVKTTAKTDEWNVNFGEVKSEEELLERFRVLIAQANIEPVVIGYNIYQWDG